jgi:hypothetical protein
MVESGLDLTFLAQMLHHAFMEAVSCTMEMLTVVLWFVMHWGFIGLLFKIRYADITFFSPSAAVDLKLPLVEQVRFALGQAAVDMKLFVHRT